jgi:hypothetical protein
MVRYYSILLLAIISLFAISCKNTNPIFNDFIGEYEMTTEVIPVYGNTEIDFLPVVKSNVTIYEEKNKLFIWENYYYSNEKNAHYLTNIQNNNYSIQEPIDCN